jgi:hypothetical protein
MAMFGHTTGKLETGWSKLHKDNLHSFLLSTRKNLVLKRENTGEKHVLLLEEKLYKHKLQCRELLEACINMRVILKQEMAVRMCENS